MDKGSGDKYNQLNRYLIKEDHMKRGTNLLLAWVVSILLTIGLVVCPAASAAEGKVYEWKLQAFATANEAKYTCLKEFAKNVEVASNGRLKIKTYPTGEIVAGPAVWDAVKNNVVQMGTGTPNWWGGKDVAWLALATGPFMLPGMAKPAAFFYEGGGLEIGNELSQKHGMLFRPANWMGSEAGIIATFPLKSLADLKGKTIRMGPGIPTEVIVEASGCSVVSLAGAETYEALQRKVIDGVEWATLDALISAKYYEVCSHLLGPAIWQPGTMEHFLINKKAYDQLPPDLKQILELGMRVSCDKSTYVAYLDGIKAYEYLQEKGIVINKFSAEDMRKFKAAADKVFAKYNAKSADFKRIYDAKVAFMKRWDPVEQFLTIPPFE
jgi:TRAP-type mannitol/chloroaromatic compound transport system substrate-binding protein